MARRMHRVSGMVRRVEDFDAWRLADELRTRVYAITANEPVKRDWKFCDQLRDAVASSLRNFSEGFGRVRHKEFAQFLRIARASLFEVTEGLRDGIARGHWRAEDVADTMVLARRAAAAISRLMTYLLSTPD